VEASPHNGGKSVIFVCLSSEGLTVSIFLVFMLRSAYKK